MGVNHQAEDKQAMVSKPVGSEVVGRDDIQVVFLVPMAAVAVRVELGDWSVKLCNDSCRSLALHSMAQVIYQRQTLYGAPIENLLCKFIRTSQGDRKLRFKSCRTRTKQCLAQSECR